MAGWSTDEDRAVDWDEENPLVVDRDDELRSTDARDRLRDDRLREDRPPHWE